MAFKLWTLKKFPNFIQLDEMDCGPTCLRIISKYYGKSFSLNYLRTISNTSRSGSSLLNIGDAAERLGFKTMAAKVKYDDLQKANPDPFICFWKKSHFIIVYRITPKKVYVSDPAYGLLTYKRDEFIANWTQDGQSGIVMLLEATEKFNEDYVSEEVTAQGLSFILPYLKKNRKLFLQLIIGLTCGSLIQLVFPFLTQSIVDVGINNNDIGFIYLILIGQLLLFLGRTAIEIIRSILLLHISNRVNIAMLASFFIKLMRLPSGYYDSKKLADILQRLSDHERVQTFLTSGTLNALFSMINILIFAIVLFIYNFKIFLIFSIGSILYFLWISLFSKKRAALDYKRFSSLVATTEKNVEIINGMQEIKLANAERKKRWEWEHLQVGLFKTNFKALTLRQIQIDGSGLINELKNILITFFAAKLVIEGQISLGIMLSITYITGQLNGPVLQITEFLQQYQGARISIERINEVYGMKNEEQDFDEVAVNNMVMPEKETITLNGVKFKYNKSPRGPYILHNINLVLPTNKVTAIVGVSGSGKTTLMKLLLKFYAPDEGEIKLGNTDLNDVLHSSWRSRCGVVMQEGFIFNDTIANNIAVGEEVVDKERLVHAAETANIFDFITALPMKFNTKIGAYGVGISTGQKQRILIARAIYKNPDFIFFDEATSALDTTNEKEIMEKLNLFFKDKTVVIIAHRLSTVYNADQIIVIDAGEVRESGTHNDLVDKKGLYYTLIKNQLELGN
jgi:ATP-binding cassette, subfamily B, bacterial